jgi:hypothetical protein
MSALAEAVRPLQGPKDYDPLVERAGTRFALFGEASHGTHEFYRERPSSRSAVESGFTAVAAEADWPDAYRLNRFVRVESDDESPEEALADFRRFPAWLWRNTDVVDFLGWLRKWNSELSPRKSIPRPRSARGLATPASTTSAPIRRSTRTKPGSRAPSPVSRRGSSSSWICNGWRLSRRAATGSTRSRTPD